jgi:hypothetical protein
MNERRLPTAWTLWAVLWRCVVFLPWMLLVFAFLLSMLIGVFALPVLAVIYAYAHSWPEAGLSLGVWIPAMWLWRRYRLWEHFEEPPALL